METPRDLEPAHDVTQILKDWSDGSGDASARLMPLVYEELRRLAREYIRRERADHTLQATALVHEAYLRMVDERIVTWKDRAHFYGIAARLMRRILVDHARAHNAAKRGGLEQKLALDEARDLPAPSATDLVALDGALEASPRPTRARVKWWSLNFLADWKRMKLRRSSRFRKRRSYATGASPSFGFVGNSAPPRISLQIAGTLCQNARLRRFPEAPYN